MILPLSLLHVLLQVQLTAVVVMAAASSPNHLQQQQQSINTRFLSSSSRSSSNWQQQQQQPLQEATFLVDSSPYDTSYDGYQQAWRYLGFYIDCSPNGRNAAAQHRRQRYLQNDDEKQQQPEGACQRYLLWAAYIDLDYAGGGTGEYQYYNTETRSWDMSACDVTNNERCAKMNCHEPADGTNKNNNNNKNWQLLGIFKQANWQGWLEQLFKHQGSCLWNRHDQNKYYEFMMENYNAWPEGCTETEVYNEDGDLMYYDLKAEGDGNMTVGLYIDAACSKDYTGDIYTPQSFLAADQDGDEKLDVLVGKYADMWNEAMSVYKVCQPCRASNLWYTDAADAQNNDDNEYRRRKLEDNNNSPNNGNFQCTDEAGYTDVNQCMMFATQTDMEYATAEDVITASRQGSLLATTIGSITYGKSLSTLNAPAESDKVFTIPVGDSNSLVIDDNTFLGISAAVLGLGILMLASSICCRLTHHIPSSPSAALKQSLMEKIPTHKDSLY